MKNELMMLERCAAAIDADGGDCCISIAIRDVVRRLTEPNTTDSYNKMEYRVISMYRNATRGRVERTIRQEEMETLDEALEFAAHFTPPKFVGAYVEQRAVGEWKRV